MFNRIISFAIVHRWFVILMTSVMAVLGVFAYQVLPIDAVPDITNVQVQINTEAPGYTPFEVETRLSFPIETALSGLPKLDYTRSLSRYGLSQVTVVFQDGTDIYFARQLIAQKLQEVRDNLPPGMTPTLGPIATGLGEIYMYTVENDTRDTTAAFSPVDLRTAQDWIVKPQLRTVPGVVDVNSIGGYQKQFHVTPKMEKILSLGLTLADLVQTIAQSSENVGAGYIEKYGQQYLVRAPGQMTSPEDIESLVVTTREGRPIFMKEIATVGLGEELRTGAATENGQEVVLGTVFMLLGENSRAVSERVARKVADISASLPPGMVIKTVYNRTTLVDSTIQTVQKNLLEGALLVIAVLFIFLGNVRAAIITACVIPLSMLFTISGMVSSRVSANLMSLGAIDFGLIVDGSLIIVEHCMSSLAREQHTRGRPLTLQERLTTVFDASKEVRHATMFGEIIIMMVYVPILALTGIEGKMFHPMAITVMMALLGALVLSLTFVPAAVSIFVKGPFPSHQGFAVQTIRSYYEPLLRRTLQRPGRTVGAAVGLFLLSAVLSMRLGSEFIPSLDEGDVALHALRIPGTSLSQAVLMQQALEERIRKIPEVSHTFTKIGTAEIATDPMPPSVADGFVIMKPRQAWPQPSKSKTALVAEIEQAVSQIPGNNYEFTQPIQMRMNELIAGVRSDVAVKVFGDDMDQLLEQGQAVAKLLATISGAADVKVEQVTGLPMISIELNRKRLARFGISMHDAQQTVSTALGGSVAGELYEGDKRFQIVVRLAEAQRSDIDSLGRLPIALPAAVTHIEQLSSAEHEDEPLRSFIPLSSIADIKHVTGPNQISRENGKRRVVVTANVRNRDLGSFVAAGQALLRSELRLPPGYWLTWGGQFEQLISAKQRLTLVIPATLLLIIMLLYYSFGSLKPALLVFSGVPLALSGGIFALYLRGIPLSVSAAVGFIAVSGVAVLNGLVMITVIRKALENHHHHSEAIITGSLERLRPVIMTALVAALGFIPMALSTGAGAEVQKPLATVVIGGIITSTALTLIVLPALCLLFLSGEKTGTR
jgi:cobalt-zinc-cadmium resistance protein CzcA